jgi:hypothetical protein
MVAEGLSCSLEFLYGGLGISKSQFSIKKKKKKILAVFFQFLVNKTLDLDPYPKPDSLKMFPL